MALKIRMRQQGRTNHRTYRLVVIDGNKPREGKYIESIGWYDPSAAREENTLSINPERAQHWLDQGAQLSDKVESLIAKAAPAVIKQYHEKTREKDAKRTAKQREARRAKAKS